MTTQAVNKLESLKGKLGDLLLGDLGSDIGVLTQHRASYFKICEEIDWELQATADLRAGDTDVDKHKKVLKEKEAALRKAIEKRDSAAFALGESICLAAEAQLMQPLKGQSEAIEARNALRSLRTEYADLEPPPGAGIFAKGKAAAKRLIVSGKIVLQEVKTKEDLRKLAYAAYETFPVDTLSNSHTSQSLDVFVKADEAVTICESTKKVSAEVLANVERRVQEIRQSDQKIEAIRKRAETEKTNAVEALVKHADEISAIPNEVIAVLEDLQEVMAVAETASAAQAKQPRGFLGFIAKALQVPCPKCKVKGYRRTAKELLEKFETDGVAWRLPDGRVTESGFAAMSKENRMVTATYMVWVNKCTYGCPNCGHSEIREETEKVMKPPRAMG